MNDLFIRYPPKVEEHVDCVVIGAGPAGLAAAAGLRNASLSFVLLESGPDAAARDRNDPQGIVEGVGGAGLFSDGKFSFFPSATALWSLAASMPPGRCGRGLGWQTSLTNAGLMLGPVAAATLGVRMGWRAIFAANLPLAISVGWLAWRRLPSSASCASSLGVAHTRRARPRLAEAVLLGRRAIVETLVCESIFYVVCYGIAFLLPVFAVHGRHWNLAIVGALLVGQSTARVVAAPAGGFLADTLGTRAPIRASLTLLVLVVLFLSRIGERTSILSILLLLIALGIALGIFVPANSAAMLAVVAAERRSTAVGLLATARNSGMAAGAAIAAELFALYSAVHRGDGASVVAAVDHTVRVFALIAFGGLVVGSLRGAQSPVCGGRMVRDGCWLS